MALSQNENNIAFSQDKNDFSQSAEKQAIKRLSANKTNCVHQKLHGKAPIAVTAMG